MLLQCEMQDGDDTGGATEAGWLKANTLESLTELNENCLALLAEQARSNAAEPLFGQFCDTWRSLDAGGRRRAAACMYLLVDAGFADSSRWQRPVPTEPAHVAPAPFFTVPGTVALTQSVFVFGWHLARCQSTAARLLLGMSAPSVAVIGRRTLGQVRALAAVHPEWLRPRWLRQPRVWRELLAAARADDDLALWRARLRGQTLLAAETRAHNLERGRRGPAPAPRPDPVSKPRRAEPAAAGHP